MDATRLLLETFIVKFVKKSTYPLWEAYLRNLYSSIWCKIGLSTHPGTGVDGASGRGWKLADFLLKHITYRCKIWSDQFLRNKSYRLLELLVSSNDL